MYNNNKSDTEVDWYADGNKLMIYWRKPSEWASKLYEWVDGSGQVDSVLTLYEIREGEVTMGTGMLVWVRVCVCVSIFVKRGNRVKHLCICLHT